MERSPKPSDASGGRGHRIPQRQVRPAETKKDAGMPASTPTRLPVPASVPPPHRRAGTFAADTFKVIAGSRDEPNVRT